MKNIEDINREAVKKIASSKKIAEFAPSAQKIIDKSLSVRQTELLVRIFKNKKITKHISKDPNLKKLESTITDKTGLNVIIKNKKNNTGSISFEYKNLEQLNRILELIKSNY